MVAGSASPGISVFELNCVGSISAACFASRGHRVAGVDPSNLEPLRRGKSSDTKEGLEETPVYRTEASTRSSSGWRREHIARGSASARGITPLAAHSPGLGPGWTPEPSTAAPVAARWRRVVTWR
jgi:hypothetical protein